MSTELLAWELCHHHMHSSSLLTTYQFPLSLEQLGLVPGSRHLGHRTASWALLPKEETCLSLSPQVPASATTYVSVAAPAVKRASPCWKYERFKRAFCVSGTLTIWLSPSCLALAKFLYHKKQFCIC